MKFKISVDVMPLKTLLDPQGKAVQNIMKNQGYENVDQVRIGKHIIFEIEASDETEAETVSKEIAEKILINPVIEEYQIKLEKAE